MISETNILNRNYLKTDILQLAYTIQNFIQEQKHGYHFFILCSYLYVKIAAGNTKRDVCGTMKIR